MKRSLALFTAFALLLAPHARAEDLSLEQAKASFNAGAAAYAAGDYLAAIQALEAAYRATPLPAIAFSLAQAERRQYFVSHEASHLARAAALYRIYLSQVERGGRRADATDALGQLEPLLLALPAGSAPTLSMPGAAPAAEKTRLLVTGRAPAARVSLDGGPAVASPLITEVPPGPHTVRVEAEGFFPAERRLVALPGVLVPADVELRERPALVLVAGAEGADVYVDGHFLGRAEKVLKLELTSGPHTFVFAKTGHKIDSLSVSLARGEERRLSVVLRNTKQRTASLILFGSGGAVALVGYWFGSGALDAEAEASKILSKRDVGTITQGELGDYRDAVRLRNQLRTASIVSLALGGAGLVTGLALFEFDQPNLGEVLRAPGGRASLTRRLSLTPSAEGVGLDARLRF